MLILNLYVNRAIVVRDELTGILHPDETVIYSCDEPPELKKTSVFQTEVALFLFLGSFFIIALIAAFVFGFARGDSLTHITAKSLIPVLWLTGIFIFVVLAHKNISKTLKLTSVVITEKRLFMAPPPDYIQNVGWEGPNPVADIIFADQLSASKGTLFGLPCLIFIRVNPHYKKISSDRLPLDKRYIHCANIEEAYESLPVYLKMPEMNFDERKDELSSTCHQRAVRFLANRKAKLGQT